MSDDWTWHYNPDAAHVVGGLPPEVVTEIERLADQLTILGRDAGDVGRGPIEGGGLRTLDIFGGRGFLVFLAPERLREISIVRVIWLG
ncbi:hypothetical protein OTB20_13815 [Streptomyces sp. H27-H1]|uniref:hypothetical protein n=1 Tax=unclassified Streptomyces TaxID=2593676 RepID=UPI00226E0313|nr:MULTISPECIES: hypothetical protein [unclassified Streptomyces]MCY0927266.1 hypothetical protein [Streptomyces sp. H27-H1]MCY0936039.1 hypothetical protein [Streptomyces sp. H34-S4]